MYNVYVIIKILKHTLNIALCIIKINFLSSLSMSSNNTPHHWNLQWNISKISYVFSNFVLFLHNWTYQWTTEVYECPIRATRLTTFSTVLISISISPVITYMTHVLISVGTFTFLFPTYFYKIERSNAIKYSKNSTNKQCYIDQDGNTAKTELLVNRRIHLLRDKSRSAVWNAVHMGQYITNKCAGCMEVKDPCIQFY